MPVAHISMLEGRSKEVKAKIAEEVTESISKHGGAPKAAVTVVFHEVSGDNWAAGGVLFNDKKAAGS